jgi:hypothetical protein
VGATPATWAVGSATTVGATPATWAVGSTAAVGTLITPESESSPNKHGARQNIRSESRSCSGDGAAAWSVLPTG